MSIISQLKPFLHSRENESTVEYETENHVLLCSPHNRKMFEVAVDTGYIKELYQEDGCTMYEHGDSHFLDTGDTVWYISTFRK